MMDEERFRLEGIDEQFRAQPAGVMFAFIKAVVELALVQPEAMPDGKDAAGYSSLPRSKSAPAWSG